MAVPPLAAILSLPLPLPAYSFHVTVNGQSAGFSEVSGLGIERDTVTYNHGLSFTEGETFITYASKKHRQISLKRGVVPGDSQFFDWLVGADAEARPMDVSLIDASGTPKVIWRIKEAIPTRMTGPTLTATSNEIAIDSLDLMVAGVSVEQG
jgi:phage tail-like protein